MTVRRRAAPVPADRDARVVTLAAARLRRGDPLGALRLIQGAS